MAGDTPRSLRTPDGIVFFVRKHKKEGKADTNS